MGPDDFPACFLLPSINKRIKYKTAKSDLQQGILKSIRQHSEVTKSLSDFGVGTKREAVKVNCPTFKTWHSTTCSLFALPHDFVIIP